ncbi:MAG: alkaline phosphatase D family protein [Candidatus Hydrogenedentota bacterium]
MSESFSSGSMDRRQFMANLGAVTAAGLVTSGAGARAAENQPSAELFSGFSSDFASTPDRVWIGEAYWANPLEDWRIHNGRLECTSNGQDRNVHVLTHQLARRPGGLDMSVRTGLLESRPNGSVGFRAGISDEISDYRGACFWGSGVNAVIGVDGQLILAGERKDLGEDVDLSDVTLRLTAEPSGNRYRLTLTASAADGSTLGEVSAEAEPDDLVGNMALVNNHTSQGNAARFWFQDWTIGGDKVQANPEQTFGPILWSMYTLSDNRDDDGYVMKMTAQMPPLGEDDSQEVILEVLRDGQWEPIATETIDAESRTATFRVARWDASNDIPYRLVYETQTTDGRPLRHERLGTVRRDPADLPVSVAGYTCQMDYGFPYNPVERNSKALDPDVLYFSGDQIYERVGHYGIIREPADRAILNYLRKYYMFGWAFGDLMRDRPTLVLPDDHDVYHGNLWGEGGREMPMEDDGIYQTSTGDRPGYIMPVSFVNVVHRTQTAHHPDFFDPTPAKRGISVFYGDMVYGRVSFAMVSDRQFKSGPQRVDTGEGRMDHLMDPAIDPETLDEAGLELLGDRQEEFLEEWASDWRGADMKLLLSGTPFHCVATHHGQHDNYLVADLDSGGWPQSASQRAVEIARKALAVHVSGDRHLASLVQHGMEEQRDAIWSFCTPAITTGYQRWWRPDEVEIPRDVENRPPHDLPHTGEYVDGLGNKVFVYAVANPEGTNHDNRYKQAQLRASGFGLVRLDKTERAIDIHCYKFLTDVTNELEEHEYAGWPKTIAQRDNDGRPIAGHLEELRNEEVEKAVVKVYDEETEELLYALRLQDNTVRPWVFRDNGVYTVELGDPDTENWKTFTGLTMVSEA